MLSERHRGAPACAVIKISGSHTIAIVLASNPGQPRSVEPRYEWAWMTKACLGPRRIGLVGLALTDAASRGKRTFLEALRPDVWCG